MDSGGGRVETRPLTAEEEAVKRNIDCIYFLASPLTCKKGSECEYRHSEGARLNPTDCYYWLHSNCLNPKCAFRHPPLDGLFGPPGTPSGIALPPSLPVSSKQIPMAHYPAYNVTKQSVLCIYIQKGQCLKGERCPFSHGPQASGNGNTYPSPQKHPQAFMKDTSGIKQCTNQQNITKVDADIVLEAPVSSTKPIIRAEGPPSNGLSHSKNLLPHPLVNKIPRSQSVHASVINNNAWSRTQNHQIHPSDEHLLNGVEPGEIIGGYSSGFDPRIDNINVKSSGDYGRMSTRSGRKPEPVNDYNRHPSDYKPVPCYKRNHHSNSVGEVKCNRTAQDYHDMKPYRISSEKSLERSQLLEKRVQQRRKSPDEVDRADLRHRLKKRKMDESRSTVSSDCSEPHRRGDRYKEDKYRGHNVESSIGTRLQGRISLPESSERDVSQLRGKRSSEEPLGGGARNLGGRLTKREDIDSLNFTGPKSLAELKGTKLVGKQDHATKSTIHTISHVKNNDMVGKAVTYQEPETAASFEGPKPLSVLLKRKREEVCGTTSSSANENNQRNEGLAVCAEEVKPSSVLELNNEDSDLRARKAEQVEEVEDLIPSRDDKLISDGKSSTKEDMLESEDYMEDDAMEDQEFHNFEQGSGVSDHEATESENFKTEYESQGEEEDELDDEEDFARKVGLIFS